MGFLDFLFGRKSSSSDDSQQKTNLEIEPFVFKSNCHQRFEDSNPTMGLQLCARTVTVEKNTSGCSGYKLEPGVGYIVKIYDNNLNKPNMSDKPMTLVAKTAEKAELRGFKIEAKTPFGWQEVDNSVYGLTVMYSNGKVSKCVFHMFDRNVFIEYRLSEEQSAPKCQSEATKQAIKQSTIPYVSLAALAWNANIKNDRAAFAIECNKLYNHFVHHPTSLLFIQSPLLVGSVFNASLRLASDDSDIQEVKAENTILCLYNCLDSENIGEKSEAAMRLFLLFTLDENAIWQKVMRLFGSPEFNVQTIPFMKLMTMPKDFQQIVNESIPTNQKILYIRTYLVTLFTIEDIDQLDTIEESGLLHEHILKYYSEVKINDTKLTEAEMSDRGRVILNYLYLDILGDIKKYSQYNK